MALQKSIILENGIPTNYHRISSVKNVINQGCIIQILSYVNMEEREKEKNTPLGSTMNIFMSGDTIVKNYVENSTIQDAYNYLKSLEKYENAIDC